MRCKHCLASFRLSTWILACGECKDHYCTRCMKRNNGIYYCEKCTVLIMRPPDLNELMKLKPKYLQEYLKRHDIPTHGLVEKHELAELLCNRVVPVRNTKMNAVCHKIFTNFESVFYQNGSNSRRTSPNTSPTCEQGGPIRPPRMNRQQPPPSQQEERPIYASTSSGNLNSPTENLPETSGEAPHTLPRPSSRTPPRPTAPPAEASVAPSSPLPVRYPKLSDFRSADDLQSLSPKELKILLNINRVDYKGCVEKIELLGKAQNLWLDNHQQRKDLPENVEDLCKLCMDAPLDCVLLECGHIAACIDCGKKLAECPICRQYVSRVVRTFKA